MIEISRTLYYKISKPILNFCVKNNITANYITFLNHFLTLTFGCYFFITRHYFLAILICLINGFLDYLDGDIAKATGQFSKLGIWLDSGFDVIIQNAVLGCIGLGCFYIGMDVFWLVLFFISNCASNFIAFNYNHTFGFSSEKGSELFRKFMDKKCHFINRIIKNIIDPTENHLSLAFYTYRYWIILGSFYDMEICFIIMTLISTLKWIVMYIVYAFYLKGDKSLYVVRALGYLDEENDDFYKL